MKEAKMTDTLNAYVLLPIPEDKLSEVHKVLTGDYAVKHVSEFRAIAAGPSSEAFSEAFREPSTAQTAFYAAASETSAAPQEGEERDADNWPWRADLHAGSKGKTKDGLWRMKSGVERPAPLVKPEAVEPEAVEELEAVEPEAAVEEPTTVPNFDDDEEAVWAQAAETAAVSAEVPAREWTDADLSSICQQAATALGGQSAVPAVKALVADFIPEGSVNHSRHIEAGRRADFAEALQGLVRKVAGREDFAFAG
jgi:hypothetical protein